MVFARRMASGWVPPVPGISMEEYKKVISALEGSSVKVKFNGTFDQIARNIGTFADMGCDGAALSTVPPEELPAAIKRLAAEVMPSYD